VRTLAGTVVGIQTQQTRTRPPQNVYAPIVRFQADGQEHEFTSRMFTNHSNWRVGQEVEVLYDPASDRMAIAGLSDWLPALEFTFVGVGFLVLGRVLWRRKWG
jgi:hypothetical protein